MKKHWKRSLSALLSATMTLGYAAPILAEEAEAEVPGSLKFEKSDITPDAKSAQAVAVDVEEEAPYEDDETVRVSIILNKESTLDAGYSTENIAKNKAAMNYRANLAEEQENVTAQIEERVLDGEKLDVEWNLTLAMNLISANVKYGQIKEIEKIAGVKSVEIENRYEAAEAETNDTAEPNMAVSNGMINSPQAYAAGFKGEGTRIAVIDTGTDTDHKSFDSEAYEYALSLEAEARGMTLEEYEESLNLLDADELAEVVSQLNVQNKRSGTTADELYLNEKLPFAYNYVDGDLDITHDNDTQGEHGSHVAGISTSNAYVADENGDFVDALEAVHVAGVAPNAQLITMKVFGKGGGAYDSDYMAAIEDAIVLGCETVNLSLGSGNPGFSNASSYQEKMKSFAESDTTVVMSAGNSGYWAENANPVGYLYGDDVSFDEVGSPGSFTNALAVASVDNDGFTGENFVVDGTPIYYTQTSGNNKELSTIAGDQDYVLIDGVGTVAEFAAIKDVLAGKIAVCSRGTTSFFEKANAAVSNGAIGVMIYNNTAGTINMSLDGYLYTAPCVALTQADGNVMRQAAEPVTDDAGNVQYYLGHMVIGNEVDVDYYNSDYYVMSDFSSWGVPGSLELKPEITAPGGNIYSVNGAIPGGEAYENMSGTSMAAPQISGMGALIGQRIDEQGLAEKTGESKRFLTQSLLMSTAIPALQEETDSYWSVLNQGSGIANVGNAAIASAYLKMGEDATASYADGKIKVELGEDADKVGNYKYSFEINNMDGTERQYTLRTDTVTQDLFEYEGMEFLDTWTAALPTDAVYTVNGEVFTPKSKIDADVNKDGDTDSKDAQAILNYVTGKNDGADLDLTAADPDGDGEVTTYDAHLILANLTTESFTVPADGSVTVEVELTLPETTKAYLDEAYKNGAYIEGYTFVEPVADEEGSVDVEYSIPILGFYGNWTDSSMYDRISYTDYLYGDDTIPYVSTTAQTNALVYTDGVTGGTYYQIGNPYAVEETYPEGKAAIRSIDKLTRFALTPTRNAAGVATVITDQNGKVLYNSAATNDVIAAYYYSSTATWRNVGATLNINKTVESLGVKEGDVITVSAVAVPEYYEGADNTITGDEIAKLWADGTLGEGAAVSTTLKIDNTEPELLGITKDLMTGNINVTAKDNNNIAYVAVLTPSGAKEYAGTVPAEHEAGETITTTIDVSEAQIGSKCMVLVADYAGNEATYVVEYGGEDPDYTGKMFGFTPSTLFGQANCWFMIDKDDFYATSTKQYEGLEPIAYSEDTVKAAEFVDGYVFFIDDKDRLMVTSQTELGDNQAVSAVSVYGLSDVADMALNKKDGNLYVLDKKNTVWTVNMLNGQAVKQFTIAGSTKMITLAIDEEGKFYSAAYGSTSTAYLYSWTEDQITENEDGSRSVVATKASTRIGGYNYVPGAMTYDYNEDVLYLAGCYNDTGSADLDNRLWKVDPETGAGTAASSNTSTYNSRFYYNVKGLYIVDGNVDKSHFQETTTIDGVSVDETSISALPGTVISVTASVTPWTAKDTTVTWSTSDASVATVTGGKITTVAPGDAVVTATSVADPTKSAEVSVHVDEVPSIELSGIVYDSDSTVKFADFNVNDPAGFTVASADMNEMAAGALKDGYIYTHGDGAMYKVNADDFSVQSLGTIADSWAYTDAAPAPETSDGNFGNLLGLCNNGTYIEFITPEEGSLTYFDMSSRLDAPLVTAAFVGQTTYTPLFGTPTPANLFVLLAADGTLYQFLAYGSSASWGVLGQVDIDLSGCEVIGSGQYVSMILDEDTGYLVLSVYKEGESAQLYLIDTETMVISNVGNFGEGVWPVVSLYQYDRPTDLTIRLGEFPAKVFEGQSKQINAEVVLAQEDKGLTYTSSNPAVATVSDTGLVTGVSEGDATITLTTKETNKDGEHVTATLNIHVVGKEIYDGTLTFNGQLTSGSSNVWAEVDVTNGDINVTEQASAPERLYAGGGDNGYLYGSASDGATSGNLYRFDVANNYAPTAGVNLAASWAPYDMTYLPAVEYENFTTPSGGYDFTGTYFDQPVMLPKNGHLSFVADFEEGNVTSFQNFYAITKAVAIAYVGVVDLGTDEDDGTEYYGPLAYTLLEDGTLTFNIFRPMGTASNLGITMNYGDLIEDTGLRFDDVTAVSMAVVSVPGDTENEHLIVTDSSNGSVVVYHITIGAETYSVGYLGTIENADALSAVFTNAEASNLDAVKAVIAEEGTTEVEAVNTTFEELEAQEAQAAEDVVVSQNADVTVNAAGFKSAASTSVKDLKAIGSLNAVTVEDPEAPEVEKGTVTIDQDKNTITLKVAANPSTNGAFSVDYDASLLTLQSTTGLALTSHNNVVDGDKGTVKVAFADKDEMRKVVSVITFSYDEKDENGLTTKLAVHVTEDGNPAEAELPEAEEIDIHITAYYAVTAEIENGTAETPEPVEEGNDVNVTLVADKNYQLPATVEVTVAGEKLAADAFTYDAETGAVTVPADAVTGDVVITASCERIVYNVAVSADNLEIAGPETVNAGDDLKVTLASTKHYALPDTIVVTVDGKELNRSDFVYDKESGSVRIDADKITGHVVISVAGERTTVDMYRVYNPNSGEHLYTKDAGEKDYLVSLGWKDEGVAWTAPKASGTPVYRVYNPNNGDHHYTTNAAEVRHLVSLGWNDEGIKWYSDENEDVPVYRVYNPNAKGAGSHHYTTNASEAQMLVSLGWNDEGIAWHGVGE